MTDVRTLLHDLAADAPRGHGEDTADRVVDLHRAQDRRRLRWAGVAAAVAVVVAVVPALVTRSSPADDAAVAAGGRVASLFDVPTRGSLADDADVVAAALAASWDDGIPYNDEGRILDPAPEDRHVAFAGEVPGGQVWALVIGRTGPQLAYTWFVDVEPGDGTGLQLGTSPRRTAAGLPLGLVDVAGDHGPLVVVAMPDQQATLFPADGADPGPPDVRSVEVGDGVLVADVVTAGGAVPAFQLDDGPVGSRPVRELDQLDTAQPLGTARFGSPLLGGSIDPTLGGDVSTCMQLAGWSVSVDPRGGLAISGPLTLAELSDADDQLVSCLDQAESAVASRAAEAAASSAAAGDGD